MIMFRWMKVSNRMLHFKYGILTGFLTIIFTLGVAVGMEYKDKLYGGKFDILDIIATLLGGIIGNVILVVVILIIKLIFV
ncbi:putative lipoprotein [uncultured phage cr54_1]|uniref:Lipoprotein n=1 Tax=uncultured phage cr54_1 TaxID=2986398 RepID=A0AAE7S1E3_9CAUD|nr:putative lipoprotein [uncultured phage cr54_1]QWM89945.1 putative lipoprotein [uncultured phage cr54_1]